MQDQHVLSSGTAVDKYKIIRVLGAGGFGITYLAEDIQLGMKVVIKEYFPNEFAIRKNDSIIVAKTSSSEDFGKGLQRFKEEAQTLAKFNHPSIVKILGYFEANQTGYFVMEYEEGIDLSEYLKQKGTLLDQEEILGIMMPILEGLKEVHQYKYLHRDIKPGNILLRHKKGPVLIDFGASKLALGEASKSITSMLTEGYAPLEQYSTNVKQQGPFTDLYAVAAVMYKMITGNVPPSAQTRSYDLLQDGVDPLLALSTMNLSKSKYDQAFLVAIDRALSIKAKDRTQTIEEFQKDIVGKFSGNQMDADNAKEKKSNSVNILIGILLLAVLVLGFMFYQNSLIGTSTTTSKNANSIEVQNIDKEVSDVSVDEENFQKEKERKEAEKLALEKKKELEHIALEQELKKLKEEKLKAQRDEVRRLKKEQEERTTKKKKLEQERLLQLAEAEQLKKSQKKDYYKKIDTYYNGRFGFSLKYPTNLLTRKTYPENGDGIWLSNSSGTVEVTPSAAFAWNTSNAKQMYKEALGWKQQNKAIEITYKRQKNNWYVLSGYDHSVNKIFYEKYYLNNGVRSGFSILFPKNEKKIYDKLVDIIAKGFKPSFGEQ